VLRSKSILAGRPQQDPLRCPGDSGVQWICNLSRSFNHHQLRSSREPSHTDRIQSMNAELVRLATRPLSDLYRRAFYRRQFVNPLEPDCPAECPKKLWVFRLLVFAQFALVITLIFASRPFEPGWLTWIVSIAGIAFGLWAIFTMGRYTNISPRLKENAPLRTSGPYRFVRHPMYLALLIFCAAYLIESFSFYCIFLWLALVLVLACKIHYEEKILRDRFPDSESYSKTTSRIIPFLF